MIDRANKVNVLTDLDVKFGKFRWWSKWIDISVFDYECVPYLIQMRISRSNSKQFKTVSIIGSWWVFGYKQVSAHSVGDLIVMKKAS